MLKRISALLASCLLSFASLLVLAPVAVHAAVDTCTWTGGTDSNYNFSDADNWTGCDNGNVPEAGDTLVFPALGTKQAPVNDTTLAYAGIQFTGAAGSCSADPYAWYNITGTQPLSISGTISNNMTGSCQEVYLELSVVATGPLVFSGTGSVFIGSGTTSNTLALGSNSLTITTDAYVYNKLTGSGAITATGGYLRLGGDNSGYSGVVTQNNFNLSLDNSNGPALGTGSAVINNGAGLYITVCDNGSFANQLTLNGTSEYPTGEFPSAKVIVSSGVCPPPSGGGSGIGGGGGPSYDEYYTADSTPTDGTVTISGALTLGADTTIKSYAKTLNITGAITGSKALSMLSGGGGTLVLTSSANGSTTTNGTYVPAKITKTLSDDLPAASVYIAGGYILTIDGKRGAVTVDSGATLMGSGTLGILTVNTGAKVAPGHSPGCMTTTGLVLSGSFDAELGGTDACTGYDQMTVNGTVNLTNGTLNTIIHGNFKPSVGNRFTIISNDGSDAVAGTFTGLAEGATVTSGSYSFKISYVGGDGNDVVLSVIGTPDTGFSLITSHPIITMITTTLLALGIAVIARRYSKIAAR